MRADQDGWVPGSWTSAGLGGQRPPGSYPGPRSPAPPAGGHRERPECMDVTLCTRLQNPDTRGADFSLSNKNLLRIPGMVVISSHHCRKLLRNHTVPVPGHHFPNSSGLIRECWGMSQRGPSRGSGVGVGVGWAGPRRSWRTGGTDIHFLPRDSSWLPGSFLTLDEAVTGKRDR